MILIRIRERDGSCILRILSHSQETAMLDGTTRAQCKAYASGKSIDLPDGRNVKIVNQMMLLPHKRRA